MNDDLSPAWLSTNDEENRSGASALPGPNLAEPTAVVRVPVSSHRVSRAPAAVVGILVSVGMGFSLLNGMDGMKAQIPGIAAKKLESTIEIRITDEGMSPRIVDAAPGQKIVWINEQNIPHILESETLLGENGSLLYTPAIFPGGSQEFWVSPLQEPGRHSYLSTTSMDIFGEINVTDANAAADPAQSSTDTLSRTLSAPVADSDALATTDQALTNEWPQDSAISDASYDMDQTTEESTSRIIESDENPDTIDSSDPLAPNPRPLGSLLNGGEESLNQDALIPYNPYTVGSDNTYVSDTAGTLHGGAPIKGHKPIRQPSTGPGLWIVSVLSIGLLAWFTRKSFKAFR